MARYQVILAYDGTHYYGFQRQKQGLEAGRFVTVQQAFEDALRSIGWRGKSILAAGRTDRGVHAVGQVVGFDLNWSHSLEKLMAAINSNLPADLAVHQVNQVNSDFHPRYDAVSRHYRYIVYCAPVREPLLDRYAWRVWPAVDLDRLAQAASELIGSHDFAAFGTPPHPGGTTIRKVMVALWRCEKGFLGSETCYRFDVVANAFLYRMVRRLVSLQIAVGQGKLSPDKVGQLLHDPPRTVIQGLAPPNGLTLLKVNYATQNQG